MKRQYEEEEEATCHPPKIARQEPRNVCNHISLTTSEFITPICTFHVLGPAGMEKFTAHVGRFKTLHQILARGNIKCGTLSYTVNGALLTAGTISFPSISTDAMHLFLKQVYYGSLDRSITELEGGNIVKTLRILQVYRLCLLLEETLQNIQVARYLALSHLHNLKGIQLLGSRSGGVILDTFRRLAQEHLYLPDTETTVKEAIINHLASNWSTYKKSGLLAHDELLGEDTLHKVTLEALMGEFPKVLNLVLMHPSLNKID